jgi:two-component system sensor histidine kinase RegB
MMPSRHRVVEMGLIQVRWLILLLQSTLAIGLLFAADFRHEPLALLGLTGGLLAIEGARFGGIKPGLVGHVAVDIGFLGVFAFLWGPHHPLQLLSMVEVALAATVLSPLGTTTVVALALGLMAADGYGQASAGDDWLHVGSHVLISALAVVAIGGFSHRVGRAFRDADQARREAITDRERGARLALVGTLASGVAHELGTPLGSITLLAEEAALDLPPEAAGHTSLSVLAEQVARCRTILDRLLLSGDVALSSSAEFGPAVRQWVDEWHAANPDTPCTPNVPTEANTLRCPGDEAQWRASIWTLLDNAKRAGGPIALSLHVTASHLELWVDDAGAGPDEEACQRAGEPFFSSWSGRGLGLYAVRTHLEAVDGTFSLTKRSPSGGRATVVVPLPREEP